MATVAEPQGTPAPSDKGPLPQMKDRPLNRHEVAAAIRAEAGNLPARKCAPQHITAQYQPDKPPAPHLPQQPRSARGI